MAGKKKAASSTSAPTAAAATPEKEPAPAPKAAAPAPAPTPAELSDEEKAALAAEAEKTLPVLAGYFNGVRRSTREDAVEWLGRMHKVPAAQAEAAFDLAVQHLSLQPQEIEVAIPAHPKGEMRTVTQFCYPA